MDKQQAENAGQNQGEQMDAEILSYADLAENSGKGAEGQSGTSAGTDGQQPPDYSSDLDLAKKIINPDDPKKNLYNTMREYKRKAEEFQKKFTDLNNEYETFKKSNVSTAEKLDKLIELQKNPEYIEFERLDESAVKQLIIDDPEKAQRYYNWLLLKQTAEKSKSGESDAELQTKKEKEKAESEQIALAQAAIADGCNSIKEKFGDAIVPEKLQELVSQTNYEDVYLISQLKNNNFDKVLTKDQRKQIAYSYLKELKDLQKKEPPHNLTSGSGSTPPIATDDDNISSFSDLAKAVIKNQNKK